MKKLLQELLPSKMVTYLRKIRSKRVVEKYQAHEISRTYSGVPLKIYLSDPLAAAWYDHDCEELPEITFLRKNGLGPGCLVFDLGAHQGVVALALARIVGEQGKIIAVEALAYNATIANKNKMINGVTNIEIIQGAIADCPGRLSFKYAFNGQIDLKDRGHGEIVAAFTIDSLRASYKTPDIVFIDVEGYECMALRGARETLEHRPVCLIEAHVGSGLEAFGGSVSELVSFFPERDYNLFMANDSQPTPIPFSLRDVITRSRFFLTAVPRRIER